jgi:hypothetical protein
MEEGEALRIGREAVQAAIEEVGDGRKALAKELEKRAAQDPRVFEAFAIAGHLIVSAGQEKKH